MSSEKNGCKRNVHMNVIYFSGFMDLFAVSMIMPLIQPHVIELGASPTLAGVLGSVYGGLQLISSPIIGKWSDNVSRQFSLLLCMILTGLGYTLLGLCSSVPVFFISRFILGCFKHSQTISRAFLSDAGKDTPHSQSTLLGNFNSFSAVGFIVGPVIGGQMAETQGGFALVACMAGLIFLLNSGLVWWMVPTEKTASCQLHKSESEPELMRSETTLSMEKVGSEELNLNISRVLSSLKDYNWPQLWDLFLSKFFAGFSMIIFRTNFTMVLKLKFGASPSTIGYMTSFSGIIAALSGFCIGSLTKRYGNNARLLLHCTVFQVIALACLTVAPSLNLLLLALVPLNLVTSVSRVSGTTLTVAAASAATDPDQKRKGQQQATPGKAKSAAAVGGVIGLGQSVMALARMSAPLVGGVAHDVAGVDAPAYISVITAAVAVAVMVACGRGLGPQTRDGLSGRTDKKDD